MKVYWYVVSALMVVFGLVKLLLLGQPASGAAFIAIGVGFILMRRYRLKRDRDRLRQSQGQAFD